MSLITRLKGLLSSGNKLHFEGSLGSALIVPTGRSTSGYLAAYGEVGWLYACANAIALGVMDVKWKLYKGETEIVKHPILDLMKFVNDFTTWEEFIVLSELYLDLTGNSFWYCVRHSEGAPPVALWPLSPSHMAVVPDKTHFIKGYVYRVGSDAIPFEPWEIIHCKFPNPSNPLWGIGPAAAIGTDIDTEIYSGKWNRNFFFNDATPGTVITYPGTLADGEFERLKAQWGKEHRGVGNAHKVAVLSGGATINKAVISQKEMDFMGLRKLNRDNIIGAFGVPLSVLGIVENVNRANAEAGDYTFAMRVIKPRLSLWRSKLNEQLCPMFGDNLSLEYVDPVPENNDFKLLAANNGLTQGAITVNEWRVEMGYEAIPTGDIFLRPFSVTAEPVKTIKRSKAWDEGKADSYWKRYIEKTEKQEAAFKKVFKALLDEQEQEVITNYENGGEAAFDKDTAITRFKDSFLPVIQQVFLTAYEDVGEKAEVFLDENAVEWIATRSLELAVLVNNTTDKELRAALMEGFSNGESIPQITARIKKFYADGYEKRAVVVARTEVIAASNEGALKRYDAMNVQKVEFYAALDERLCPECAALHHKEFPTKDSTGIIPVHCQCRCTWLPVV